MLAGRLRSNGFDAQVFPRRGVSGLVTSIRSSAPDAIVIDLTRMPSYGRAVGGLIREQKSIRHIPLVFLEGDPEKTKLVRKVLPDAFFAPFLKLGAMIEKAIREAPKDPVAPRHTAVPLAGKLRVQDGSVVALRSAPDGFLEKLPAIRVTRKIADAEMIFCFVKSMAALARELQTIGPDLEPGQTFWVIWPKQSGKLASDVTMPRISAMCVEAGLSGYKLCAVDEVWSGLALTRKRKPR